MNKLLLFSLLISLFCVFSCKRTYEKPVINEDKFIEVLADMHIAEEMVTKFKLADRDSVGQLYYSEIGIIHDLDTSFITQQIQILQSNPEYSFELYQKVYKFLDEKSTIANKENK